MIRLYLIILIILLNQVFALPLTSAVRVLCTYQAITVLAEFLTNLVTTDENEVPARAAEQLPAEQWIAISEGCKYKEADQGRRIPWIIMPEPLASTLYEFP